MSDWKSLLAAAGEPLAANQMRLAGAPAKPVKLIQTSVTVARLQLYENVADAIPHFDGSDDLQRAEHHLRGVQSGQAGWSVVNRLMASSFCVHYSFSMMAMDEAAAGERAAPPILAAAWGRGAMRGPVVAVLALGRTVGSSERDASEREIAAASRRRTRCRIPRRSACVGMERPPHARGLDYASRKYLGAARSPENSRTCATV